MMILGMSGKKNHFSILCIESSLPIFQVLCNNHVNKISAKSIAQYEVNNGLLT